MEEENFASLVDWGLVFHIAVDLNGEEERNKFDDQCL